MLIALVDIADFLLQILTWVIIIQVIISWLFAFNGINPHSCWARAFA